MNSIYYVYTCLYGLEKGSAEKTAGLKRRYFHKENLMAKRSLKVAVGCDPNAAELKETIKEFLKAEGHVFEDFGSDDPIYPNVAFKVGEAVAAGKYDRGILFCGTGIGMSIAANKVPGIYAALLADPYSAERAIKSNNTNVATLGQQTVGTHVAKPF